MQTTNNNRDSTQLNTVHSSLLHEIDSNLCSITHKQPPQKLRHLKARPGHPFSGSATLGRSSRLWFDCPQFPLQSSNNCVSAEQLVRSGIGVTGTGRGPREFIKTCPTAFPSDGSINIISAINSGSSLNICSTYQQSLREKRLGFLQDYQIVGTTGHSGSVVLVKKGGSLPRLKFSTGKEDSAQSTENISTRNCKVKPSQNHPMIETIFRTTKAPRV